MRKYTKNKPTFPSEETLAKSLFLGILKVEKKWTTKVQNWGIIYSQLTILFADIGYIIEVASLDYMFTQSFGWSLG